MVGRFIDAITIWKMRGVYGGLDVGAWAGPSISNSKTKRPRDERNGVSEGRFFFYSSLLSSPD